MMYIYIWIKLRGAKSRSNIFNHIADIVFYLYIQKENVQNLLINMMIFNYNVGTKIFCIDMNKFICVWDGEFFSDLFRWMNFILLINSISIWLSTFCFLVHI